MSQITHSIHVSITMFRRFFQLLLISFAVGCFYQNTVDAFRVLVSAPNLMHSHMALHISIADMLAEQGGHEVTLLIQQWNPDNNFPPPPEQENHTRWTRSQRVIQHSVSGRDRQKQRQLIKAMPFFQSNIWTSDYVNFFHAGLKPMMTEMFTTSCKGLLQDSHLLATLRQLHFDVAIGEWFDGCTLALFRLLNIPTTMLTSAIPMSSAMAHDLGIPTPIYVPDVNFAPPEGTAMGIWQRAWNLYRRHQEMQDMCNVFNWDAIIEPLVGPGLLPSNRQLLLDSSFVLINTNEYLDLATPTSAKVKHIGGFALDRNASPRKLSPEMEGLLLDADNGAVLVSFGSLADPRQMPAKMLAAFLDAFAAFPEHKFIWKFKEDAEEASSSNHTSAAASLSQVQPKFPANVRRFDWVDQKALLAHPKLRLFISHCGLNSLNEAVVEAVPLLCIPIFGDQTYNTAIVNQRRIGRALLKSQLNVPNLRHSLEQLLAEGNQYAKNMRTTSRKMALAPFQPQEVLLRHVEFAAEFQGQFDELNLEAVRMSTMALWGLDFMIPLALAAASLLALFTRICWLLAVRMSRTVAKAKLE